MAEIRIINKTFKKLYDSLDSLGTAIFLALENNDLKGIEYIFNTKIPDQIYEERKADLLSYAYSLDRINIADSLIHHNTKFNSLDLLHAHPIVGNLSLYEKHLGGISDIVSNMDYEQAIAIVRSLSLPPRVYEAEHSCFNISYALISHSYMGENSFHKLVKGYSSLIESASNYPIAMQTLTTVALGLELNGTKTMLVVPNVQHAHREAIYKPASAIYEKDIIYMPFYKYDNYEKGVFLHELGHYAQNLLFRNDLLPTIL